MGKIRGMNKKQWIEVAAHLEREEWGFICNAAHDLGYDNVGRVAELNGIDGSHILEPDDDPQYAGREPRVLLCLLLAAMTEKERKEIL